jgi:hypothetical protein
VIVDLPSAPIGSVKSLIVAQIDALGNCQTVDGQDCGS